jgi:tetratricopeptide (TPR) repeat protein
MNALPAAQYRLAQHYLDKLRAANHAFQRGRASATYALNVFEKEQAQINHWCGWAASRVVHDPESARLCIRFALDGYRILHIRQHPQMLSDHLKSALTAARQQGDTLAECALLFSLFRVHLTISDLDAASEYTHILLKVADSIHESLYRARAFFALGCVQEERGLYAEAKQNYLASLDIFEQHQAAEDMSAALNGLGSVELYVGNYTQAQAYFLRHLALAEASRQQSDIGRALFAVAQGYLGLDDSVSAKLYAERGVALCRMLNYKGMLCGGLLTLGACEIELGHLESASTYLEEGIQIARDIDSQRNVIHGLSTLGYTQFRLGCYPQALDILGEALEMARDMGQPRFVCNVLRNITNTHLMLGDLEVAQDKLREGLLLAQSLGSDYQKTKTLCSAVLLWKTRGWLEQAAVWSGLLFDKSDIDQPVFLPLFAELEAALGSERYQRLLAQGSAKSLDDAIAEVQAALIETQDGRIPHAPGV